MLEDVMKKMIFAAVAAVFCLLLTACDNGGKSDANDELAGNDEIVNDDTMTDDIVNDDEIDWDHVGHGDEPCFPNNTCHTGLVCKNGKCVDDGGLSDVGKLGHECYPDGSCRSDDMVCEKGICVERSAQTDDIVTDDIATDETITDEEVDNTVTDEDTVQADEAVIDETITDNTVTDDTVTPEADNITPDVDNTDPFTGTEAGHPCYPNNTCESLKGLICVEGTCQYPGTDTAVIDVDMVDEDVVSESETDVDNVTDEVISDDDVLLTDEEPVDTDIAPDTDTVPTNIGNYGQACYPNHTCNGILVCIQGTEVCADEPQAVDGQYQGVCWDWRSPDSGKTTCEAEGILWSPARWLETSEEFPLCIGSSTRRPYLAECQLQTASGEPRSSVWYKYPPTEN